MTRNKVKLAWITNNTIRRASLKKRRLGLVKKVKELTTLCGIDACLLMYNPGEQEPMAWPSPDEVKQLIEKFHLVPELERTKKTINMETHVKEMLSKVQDQLIKLNIKNKEEEVGQFMHQMHRGKMMDGFNLNELDALIWFGETRNKPKKTNSSAGVGGNEREVVEPLSWDDWFHNLMNSNEFIVGASSSNLWSDMGTTQYNTYVAPGSLNVSHADLGLLGPSIGGSSSAAAEQVLPRHPYGNGSSSAAAEEVSPRYPFGGGSSTTTAEQVPTRYPLGGGSSTAAEHVSPRHPFGDVSSSVDVADLGLPPFGTLNTPMVDADMTEGDYFNLFGGHDMGPGHYPLGPVGSGSPKTNRGVPTSSGEM
ncbi:hypothetical protein F3Y22_tig00110551pilonHSYRG00104 [Hibiscus syriacus]|uniref:MADS-box domain-containing protein n=1 Tax=Hibiscus syriacus TaxID=106335 RepID=A0A6A3AAD8_HIBSY|nr:hypothetical protein F3Y22_tig00110551pilonHSYRG00104 [Hibiscus syriacus]